MRIHILGELSWLQESWCEEEALKSALCRGKRKRKLKVLVTQKRRGKNGVKALPTRVEHEEKRLGPSPVKAPGINADAPSLCCHASLSLSFAKVECRTGEPLSCARLNACFQNLCMLKNSQILANDPPAAGHIWYKTIAIQSKNMASRPQKRSRWNRIPRLLRQPPASKDLCKSGLPPSRGTQGGPAHTPLPRSPPPTPTPEAGS